MSEFLPPEPIDGGIPQQSPPQKSLVLPLLIVLSGVALGGGYLYLDTTYPNLFRDTVDKITTVIPGYNRQAATTTETQKLTTLPTRSPYPLLPDDGTAGTFKVSQGEHDGPPFTEIRIAPLDASIAQDVTITVSLASPIKVTSVAGTLYTDTGKISLVFQRASQSKDVEKWKTSFTLTQSVLYTYKLNLAASDGASISRIDMAIRNQ